LITIFSDSSNTANILLFVLPAPMKLGFARVLSVTMAKNGLPDTLANDANAFGAPFPAFILQNWSTTSHLSFAKFSSVFGGTFYNVSVAEEVTGGQLDVLLRTQSFVSAATCVKELPELVGRMCIGVSLSSSTYARVGPDKYGDQVRCENVGKRAKVLILGWRRILAWRPAFLG
jgi:hypothetical protein